MHRDAESPALGRAHFRGPGGWEPRDLPRNVRFLGHLDGDEKRDRLSSAWALVNTSIHESLPTSFLESLACETPIVSCTNEDDVARRFGVFTGNAGGDGVALLPAFEAGLRGLLECEDIRVARGQGGRAWVEATHGAAAFSAAFRRIGDRLGQHRKTSPA